jgi:thiol:disulfide interchange protein
MIIFKKHFAIGFLAILVNSVSHAQFTSPSQAFKVSAIKSIDEIEITLAPQGDFFLYKDKITVYDGQSKTPMPIKSISGKTKLKKLPDASSRYVYESAAQVYVAKPKGEFLKVDYQGCSHQGICLPPQHKWIRVSND